MRHIKKFSTSVLVALSLFGLIASQSASAVCVDAECGILETTCPGCHGVIINGIQVAGIGGKTCTQRSVSAWLTTLNKMKNKGCSVVAGTEQILAEYLACVGNPACTTSSTSSTSSTSTSSTSSTTSTVPQGQTVTCYRADGSSFTHTVMPTDMNVCPPGSSFNPPPPCPDGVLTLLGPVWICTATSSTSTSSTSSSSTTSTTLCNTYVNGTAQYPYSGSGSCHSFANDDVTGLHIVRDQSYCKKHMSHLNSKGNHVHAYPHPVCM